MIGNRILGAMLKFISLFTPPYFNKIYTIYTKNRFKSIGWATSFERFSLLQGENYITIGSNVWIGEGCYLTAWSSYRGQHFSPEIIISDRVTIGPHAHITAINRITIGKGVLTGKYITITDNSHGKSESIDDLMELPIERPLYSKGPVVIEDNVWIGDKVVVLPNVRIGKGSVIGANSVVTKDIPPYCVVAGNPAKIIKDLRNKD